MCGFFAILGGSSDYEAETRALALLDHRGPDSHAIMRSPGVSMGHTRLSVVDLDPRSNQPFTSRSGRFSMVYNGEVFNFKELAQKYEISMSTDSDTELVVELFERIGSKMLAEFIGMYSIVIWDKHLREAFVARDRLGVKPLYYAKVGDSLIYCSEIPAILNFLPSTRLRTSAIKEVETLRWYLAGQTLYEGVFSFPAAHYRIGDTFTRYWDLPAQASSPPDQEEFESLLESAVQYRMMSDVPVGSFLSGGVDSAVIASLSKVERTWSVGMETTNEFEQSIESSRVLESKHRNLGLTPSEFVARARELIAKKGDLVLVPNEVLVYALAESIKTENTVVLSGEGADELMGSYDRIFDFFAESNVLGVEDFARLYCYTDDPDLDVVREALDPFQRETPYQTLSAFFQIFHLEGLLRRLDNATMQRGVEARVPFVDHRLVEMTFGVSYGWKSRDGLSKYPLRLMARRLVGADIALRKKVGFPVDINHILQSEGYKVRQNPYESWLAFNLDVMGIEVD